MKILVTGCAGFIGAACCQKLLARGDEVIGIDNLNDYYAVSLKLDRLELLKAQKNFNFQQIDIKDGNALAAIVAKEKPTHILHLAAQAGVRYSITHPQTYIESNLVGFANILEIARNSSIKHLVYASSSSVYGANKKLPYAVTDQVDNPVSLYAATKKSNELMAHSYSHLYGIPMTGLRYFTVYGPWGRPDMAPMIFANKIMRGEAIDVFNQGDHSRDFTYIDDIVAGTLLVLDNPPNGSIPNKLYNIGFGSPMQLLEFIELLENNLGKKATKNFLPKQAGDVDHTWADISTLKSDFGYAPKIHLQEGIKYFVEWFLEYQS